MRRLLLLPLARCAVLPLDDARTGLVSAGAAVEFGYLSASNALVRVHARGIITEPVGAGLRGMAGWGLTACNVSAFGLCTTSFGHVFPMGQPRAGPVFGLPLGFNQLGCERGQGRLMMDHPVYEISACDVLDAGLDVVFARGRVYVRDNQMWGPVYWAIVVSCVILVSRHS